MGVFVARALGARVLCRGGDEVGDSNEGGGRAVKVLQAHNSTMVRGGGEEFFDGIGALLEDRGHQVVLLTRSNESLRRRFWRKVCAFFGGIYSVPARIAMSRLIRGARPDLVHVHGINPLLSPSVLVAARRARLPLVMHVHAYMLTCPIGLHLRKGVVCDLCLGGREYWCALKNCRGSVFESIGYALRNAVTRKLGLVTKSVTIYASPTVFLKRWLVAAGFPAERIVVIPNMAAIPGTTADPATGAYVAYAGRMSPEKGINTLIAAAALTGLPLHLAGDNSTEGHYVSEEPRNVTFAGWLNRGQLDDFYRNARFAVVPSIWFEVSPLVIAEAMSHGLPVIASRIGGMPDIVEDGVTGLLFEPGNANDLAAKMRHLWDSPELCRRMGQAGREKAIREYSDDVYYERLMAVYLKAISLAKEGV